MNDYISRETNGDDYVRRADIIEKFMDRLPSISVGYLCKIADEISPADVRPVKRGHWVWNPNGMDWGLGAWCCDRCRIKAETWWANDRKNNPLRCSGGRFCGNCGADMRPEGGADG